MPRNRMIQASFWKDEKIGRLTPCARLAFIGLWNLAEDNGVGRAHPALLSSELFPYDNMSADEFAGLLEQLEREKLIWLYEMDDQKYYQVVNFLKHQSIKKWIEPKSPALHPVVRKGRGSEEPDEQVGHRLPTTISPIENKIKEIENNAKEKKKAYGPYDNVLLTDAQLANLYSIFSEEQVCQAIRGLSTYIDLNADLLSNHAEAIYDWIGGKTDPYRLGGIYDSKRNETTGAACT